MIYLRRPDSEDSYTVTPTIFPDSTSQVWKLPEAWLDPTRPVSVVWDWNDANDGLHEGSFMHLAQLKTLLDVHGVKASLNLPYLPYARQDKDPSNNATFALHSFAALINFLSFSAVIAVDPHSDMAEELFNNFQPVYPIARTVEAFKSSESDVACYPDAGALAKYGEIFNFPYVHGEKVRNQATGAIESLKLVGDVSNKRVLIVDDLCDAGGTFISLAKTLYEAGAKEVSLFVSHGLFTKGMKPLFDAGIKTIFVKESRYDA